jgi:hypothetical protein
MLDYFEKESDDSSFSSGFGVDITPLKDRKVLIVEDIYCGDTIRTALQDSGMRPSLKTHFPSDLLYLMNQGVIDSSVIHPITENNPALMFKSIRATYRRYPRMIILKGVPSKEGMIRGYIDLQNEGIPVIDKGSQDYTLMIVRTLVDLFNK